MMGDPQLWCAGVAALAVLLVLLRQLPAWRVIAARLWCSRRIPGPPPAHWLLGHLPVLLSRPGESFRLFGEWDKAHGPVWTVRFMWNAVSRRFPLTQQPLGSRSAAPLLQGPQAARRTAPPLLAHSKAASAWLALPSRCEPCRGEVTTKRVASAQLMRPSQQRGGASTAPMLPLSRVRRWWWCLTQTCLARCCGLGRATWRNTWWAGDTPRHGICLRHLMALTTCLDRVAHSSLLVLLCHNSICRVRAWPW
jgi:hypothetical protein